MIEYCLSEYVQSAIIGDSARMKSVMHENAQIYGFLEGELFAGPMQLLYDYVDERDGASTLKWNATLVDETDGVGIARVLIENWHGHDFTDYFTLLKIDGNWKIMNKVFAHK